MNEEEAIEKIKWSIQINNATKEINGDSTSINVKVLETVLNLLEKKDKIIDEMAGEFRTKTLMYSDMSKEEVKQYFERKVKNEN